MPIRARRSRGVTTVRANKFLQVARSIKSTALLTGCIAILAGCAGKGFHNADPATVESTSQWVELSKPGPNHKVLQSFVGAWDLEIEHYAVLGGKPTISHGTATLAWTLGNRFLREDFHGEVEGEKFDGVGFYGYDNGKGVFNVVWMDSLSTTLSISEGSFSTEEQLFTFTSRVWDPVANRERETRSTIKLLSDDEHVFTSYAPGPDGKEAKAFEVRYKRSGGVER